MSSSESFSVPYEKPTPAGFTGLKKKREREREREGREVNDL
jgi:hypothetical protein